MQVTPRTVSKPLNINPKKIVFYIIFFLAYCFSGILTMLDIFPYRMGLISLFVIPLIPLYGLKIDRVVIFYLLLTSVIFLSTWYNNIPLISLGFFLRIVLFSFLIYYLVQCYINSKNITTIIRISVIIGLIQLPVLIFQLNTYHWLPETITKGLNLVPLDYTFGTFNFKGDYSMTFFLIVLIIFLLFDKKRNYIIPYRFFVILWFTGTVFLAESDIAKAILLLVWGFYFISHLNRRIGAYLSIILILAMLIILATGSSVEFGNLTHKLTVEIQRVFNGEGLDIYLSGGYARGAALYYFFTNDLLLIGDGPSRYIDPITRIPLRGNFGHLFTFYAEVGLLGWLFSMLIFIQIAFQYQNGKIRLSWINFLTFVTLSILSFTSQVMNDISIVLIYCLISKTYLIPSISLSTSKQQMVITS